MADVQLVSAPLDQELGLYEEGEFVPMGLLWIASFLKNEGFGVEIIDGQHNSLDSIKSRLNAPVIGATFTIRSSHSLDEIVKTAKGLGSTTVVGGQAATQLARQLVDNPNIDYVVKYDGEVPMKLIAEGTNKESIPNIVYKEWTNTRENWIELSELERLPPVDWDIPGIDKTLYWKAHQATMKPGHYSSSYSQPLSAFTKKGCPMRLGGNGCSFCSRIDNELRSRTPRQVYNEFRYLVSLGADRIEEFSDSWVYDRAWLEELVRIADEEGAWNAPVRIYGDVRYLQDEEIIGVLKRLEVDSVILGIESGNENILRRNGKNMSRSQVLRTASLLGDAEIMASPSYVLGLIGETRDTLEDTFRIADEIRERCVVEVGTFCTMTPFPGSKAWSYLLEDQNMHKKYSRTYHFDMNELQRDFISKFTDLGTEGLEYISGRREEYLKTREEGVSLLK